VNIQLNMSRVLRIQRNSCARQYCCTVCTNFGCHFHTAGGRRLRDGVQRRCWWWRRWVGLSVRDTFRLVI